MKKITMPDGEHNLCSYENRGLVYFWVENNRTHERVRRMDGFVEGKVSAQNFDHVVELARKRFKPQLRFDPRNRGKL